MTYLRWLVACLAGVFLVACGASGDPVDLGAGDAVRGGELWGANCAACHGSTLRGTPSGPSMLLQLYAPAHHADEAFLLAVRRGVAPHHWTFGPMPASPGLTDRDVADIVAFVREQQRDAGFGG